MAVDPVQAVHSSAAAQNIAAVDSAQRSQSAPGQAAPKSSLPHDKVTISAAAQAKQAAAAGDRDHDGDSR